MQLTGFILTGLLSIASVFAAPGSEQFGFLTIRSGSALQYAGIVAEDSQLYFGSGSSANALTGTVTDCGFLQFQDGSYAYLNEHGSVLKGPRNDAMPGFQIRDGYLEYQGGSFSGVREDGRYRVVADGDSEGVGVAIRALSLQGQNGASVPDYTPSGTNCWALGPAAFITSTSSA